MRIDQHLVVAVQPVAHVQDGQVLVGAPLAVEVASAALVGQADRVALEHRRGQPPQLLAPRQRVQHRIGVGVLRVDPGARLRGLLVLEPAIRVGHLHAVQRVDDFPNFRGRGRRHVDSRLLGGAGRHQRRTGDPSDSSRSGHVLLPSVEAFSLAYSDTPPSTAPSVTDCHPCRCRLVSTVGHLRPRRDAAESVGLPPPGALHCRLARNRPRLAANGRMMRSSYQLRSPGGCFSRSHFDIAETLLDLSAM